jgi:dethiobiotin synthase
MFRGIFVTGTDTNVGKTVVSAALMLRFRDEAPLRYWKPIQTGIERDDDSAEVARLAACRADEIFNCGVRLPGSVSPQLAARRHGTRITVRALVEHLRDVDLTLRQAQRRPEPGREVKVPSTPPRWIVEGAGGVFAPLSNHESMLDLMVALGLPVVVVARSTLGTINHTRLTVEALRRRKVRVAGVVMVGHADEENRAAIEWHAAAEVIAQMPVFAPLAPEGLAHWVTQEFDRNGVLFGCLR